MGFTNLVIFVGPSQVNTVILCVVTGWVASGSFRVLVLLAALGFTVTFLVFIIFYFSVMRFGECKSRYGIRMG